MCYSVYMNVLTIPKELAREGDLVVVRRAEYESLVRHAKAQNVPAKPLKKAAKKLPAWLRASLKDVEEGRVSGPFNTVEELMAHLEK